MTQKDRYFAEFERIRGILNRDWNPIPGTPDDEYDSYAKRIVSMIVNEKASAESIATYLLSVERDLMGYDGNAADAAKAAINILRETEPPR